MGKPAAAVAIDPQHRRDPGDGFLSVVQPEHVRHPSTAARSRKNDTRLRKNPSRPLLNRAINDTFPPGSTFKLITSSAAFKHGQGRQPELDHLGPAVLPPARQPQHADQRRGGTLRERQADDPVRADACRATRRSPSSGVTVGGRSAARNGERLRLQQPEPDHPAAGHRERIPGADRPRADRAVRDRPVQRHRDAAPGGDGRGRHRQRRHDDAAVPGRPDQGARPVDRAERAACRLREPDLGRAGWLPHRR